IAYGGKDLTARQNKDDCAKKDYSSDVLGSHAFTVLCCDVNNIHQILHGRSPEQAGVFTTVLYWHRSKDHNKK
ncbi:MAG TPA: hypothetical protein VK470_14385, partial [Bacteroidota bacterium]|nr:hypothetical protein [Bacteroidota bacterium]